MKNSYKFFPYYFFEVAVTALFTVEAVLLLAVLFPSSIGREIDIAAPYTPRPEWYFLFLYQLTKYFSGKWTFIGAVFLPGIVFCALLLTPFLDSSKETTLNRRPIAAAAGFSMLFAIVALTLLALL